VYKVNHVLSYFDPKQLDEKDIPNLIYELSGAIWHDYQKKNSNNITYPLMSSPLLFNPFCPFQELGIWRESPFPSIEEGPAPQGS